MRFYLRSHVPESAELLSMRERFNQLGIDLSNVLELEIEPEIHQATLRVMSEVLDLPSETCQFSALHGLGHWHAHHPEQVEQIVDAFLTRHKDLRPDPIEYALRARLGSVL
jgi:hypothetical protein